MSSRFISFMAAAILAAGCASAVEESATGERVVGAYVFGVERSGLPDPSLVTHINYAFGHVNETFDGLYMPDAESLDKVVALKQEKPSLKVLLSVGGWGSGRFSEMAADPARREAFARSCAEFAAAHSLDGIDIDWEYPTSSMAEISSSPDDTDNFTLLMHDLRLALGEEALLTIATACTAEYIDFKAILPYIDYVNIMGYDMAMPPYHHSPLYRSEIAENWTSEESVKAHLKAGVPPSKLVLGMPLYGKGMRDAAGKDGYTEVWDEVAKVPYIADSEGKLVFGFENERSLAEKCKFIVDNNLLGGMYWEWGSDSGDRLLVKTVFEGLAGNRLPELLVLTERGGQHGTFTDAAISWLAEEGKKLGFHFTEINHATPITSAYLDCFDAMAQLDYPPYTWTPEGEQSFISHMRDGSLGWIGFHHATLLGEFDGFPMWQWFSDFMGGIRFNNYIASFADGTVHVEDSSFPVFEGVDSVFVLKGDEWYTYDKDPRDSPAIKVLARVDEDSYNPPSDIRMGDHPVVWTNTSVAAPNVYFQFGHSGKLFEDGNFVRMFENALRFVLYN